MSSLTFKNGTHLTWGAGDDGGGSTQYEDFLNAIPAGSKYNNCLEWCAGLSAIGFSLLDSEIIQNLTLMDLHEPALTRAMENAKRNNLQSKVKYYVCDEVRKLPNTEKFDLVVANPPHSLHDEWMTDDGILETIYGEHRRLVVDKDFAIHKEFFSNISNYLNENADIFLSENQPHQMLIDMATENGFTYINSIAAPMLAQTGNPGSVIMRFKK